jgi:hypothetical protein
MFLKQTLDWMRLYPLLEEKSYSTENRYYMLSITSVAEFQRYNCHVKLIFILK